MMKMNKELFIVFSNRAAGQMWISSVDYDTDWSYQEVGGVHSSNEFESFDIKECEDYIEECIKNSKEYLVLWDRYYDEVWIEEWDCCSGTYQELENNVGGSIQRIFTKREDAEKYIKNL